MAGMFDDLIPAQSPQQQMGGLSFDDLVPPAPPQASWADTGIDVLRGFGTGLVSGVTGLAGTIGDAKQMTGDVIGMGADMLGVSPTIRDAAVAVGKGLTFPGAFAAPTSETLKGGVEKVTGPLPEAETFLGQTAQRIGEFAPAAIGGPGTFARKAAMTVVPAVASEVAGRIPGVEGSAYQPYVETAAGLASGLPVAGIGTGKAMKAMRENAPSMEDVKRLKDAAYQTLDDARILFSGSDLKSAAMKAKSEIAKRGWTPAAGGETGRMMKRIDDLLGPRKYAGWTTVDTLLSDAKEILRSGADKTTKGDVSIIIKHFENLIEKGKLVSLGGMSKDEIAPTVKAARELAKRNIVASKIEDMKGSLPGYLSGDESGMRNQFGSYLRDQKKGKYLTEVEKKAFGNVVRREGALNVAHNLGSRIGQITGFNSGSGIGAGIGFAVGGPVGAAVGAGVGGVGTVGAQLGFRKLMDKVTEKAVDDAMKTVLAGKKAQGEAMTQKAKETLRAQIRAALTADAAVAPVRDNWFLQDANGTTYSVPR